MFRIFAVSVMIAFAALEVGLAEAENRQCYGHSGTGNKRRELNELLEELIARLSKREPVENPLSKFCGAPNVCIKGNFYFEVGNDHTAIVEYYESTDELFIRVDDDDAGETVMEDVKNGMDKTALTNFGPYESGSFKMAGKDCKVTFDKIIPRDGDLGVPMTVVNFCITCQ